MDSGTASRFFYSAKADAQDRFGGKHPTVKPVNLMRWVTRLVTPPNGLVLDLFAGSGTMGAAAVTEGFRAILIEAYPEYQADIRVRLAWIDRWACRIMGLRRRWQHLKQIHLPHPCVPLPRDPGAEERVGGMLGLIMLDVLVSLANIRINDTQRGFRVDFD